MPSDPEDTAELRVEQTRRAQRERAAADDAGDPDEAAQHDRRAERAAYLATKLAEREDSEDEDRGRVR